MREFHKTLIDLLGESYDPEKHRQGVDLAFELEPHASREMLPEKLLRMLDADRGKTPLIGFNISGLIYNRPEVAQSQYRLKADYREAVRVFLDNVLKGSDANVVLVPHVMTLASNYESDHEACQHLTEFSNLTGPNVSSWPRIRLISIRLNG